MPPRPDVSAASAAKGTTRSAIGRPSVASPRNATPWTIASMSAPGVESEIGEFVRAAAPRTSTTTMTSLEIAMAVRISPIRRNHDAVFGQSRPESPSGKNAVVTRISTVRIASSSHSTSAASAAQSASSSAPMAATPPPPTMVVTPSAVPRRGERGGDRDAGGALNDLARDVDETEEELDEREADESADAS